MNATVLSRDEMSIACDDDVIIARTKARELAERIGLNPFATAAVVTATSELGRNVWRHATRGKAIFSVIESWPATADDGAGRVGIHAEFEDDGPGIANVELALAGGNSTVKSLGLGLAGSRRLADEFALDSVVGKGTRVSFTKWKRR